MLKTIGKILIGLVVLIVAFIVFAVYQLYSQFGKFDDVSLINTTEVYDTIPFYYSNSGHILVDLGVGQKGKKYPFIMDSGASSFIFEDYAEEFDLESNGHSFSINSNGEYLISPIKKIGAIQLGEAHFEKFTVKIQEIRSSCKNEAYGLIGKDVMRHLVWQINFQENYLIMSSNKAKISNPENSITIDLRENKLSHHLYVDFYLNDDSSKTSAMVDLGSNGVLSLKESSLGEHLNSMPRKFVLGEGSSGLGSGKGSQEESSLLLERLSFSRSKLTVNDVLVDTSPSKLNMMGLGFLDHFILTLNWYDKQMVLSPAKEEYNFIYNGWGLSTEFNDEEGIVVVRSVVEDSPANLSGLKYQDKVLAINEFIFEDEDDYCMYRSSNKGDTLRVRYIAEGIEKSTVLVKKPVF